MTKRKGRTTAQKPADPQQDVVSQAVPEAVAAPEDETVVAVSGREAAAADAQEHQAEPNVPADAGAAVVEHAPSAAEEQPDPIDTDLGEETASEGGASADAGGQDAGKEAEQDPASVVDEETLNDGQELEGQVGAAVDPDGNPPSGDVPGHGETAPDGTAGTAGVQPELDRGNSAADVDTDRFPEDAGAEDSDGTVPETGASTADGQADGDVSGAEGDLSSVYAGDAAIAAAEEAAQAVAGYLELHSLTDSELERINIFTAALNSTATNAMAEIAREIRTHDDMAAVAATQLNILGIIDNPVLTDAEQLVVQTFVNVVLGIDRFDRQLEERHAAAEAAANREKPRPVPLEETNLEPTDGAMDLVGSR